MVESNSATHTGAPRPLKIGLTYDLKADYRAAGFSGDQLMEFDEQDTVDGLAGALAAGGHEVNRVGRGVELARRFAGGERWDLVFNIAEGVQGRSREAQVPALCELFDQPYTFSDPLTCALTLDKPLAKRVIRDHGLATAPFAVVRAEGEVEHVDLQPPLFAKPVAEGSSKGISERSRIGSSTELQAACRELLSRFAQPVLVETYLPGREMTVGIVGNGDGARVVGVMEVHFNADSVGDYTAVNKDEYERRVSYHLLDGEPLGLACRSLALAAYRALGCRDAGRVDLRCDSLGRPHFLELNPLPGLHPIRSDLPILSRLAGVSYDELIRRIVASAATRWGLG
jgi:D-alanine-D-alanine ligase